MKDLDVYMSRLRFRLRSLTVPESYFKTMGHPYINTPNGRVLRPSLTHHSHMGI